MWMALNRSALPATPASALIALQIRIAGYIYVVFDWRFVCAWAADLEFFGSYDFHVFSFDCFCWALVLGILLGLG